MSRPGRVAVRLTVNGEARSVDLADSGQVLADALRDDLGCVDVKIGCREGACGACTVMVDGRARLACLTFLARLDGAVVETVSSIAASEAGHEIVDALVENRGLQCGFCSPGVVAALAAHRRTGVRATNSTEVADLMRGHLCRCTGYRGILDAAAQVLSSSSSRQEA